MTDAIYVCGVPSDMHHVIKVVDEPERWCFHERKRRTGKHILMGVDFDWLQRTEAWGWAEPFWKYRCDGCGGDYRLGFGMVWEYE